MKNNFLYIFIFIGFTSIAQELNLPVFTQYLSDNKFVISPTFAGIGDNLRVRVNGLTQWVGIKDAPDNASLYADMRIASRSGVGLSIYADKNGYTKQSGVKFSFAQHLVLDYYSERYLSLGLSYNINNFNIDISKFNLPNIDPSIVNSRSNNNNNFDLSALFRQKQFYISFNANNILDKTIDKFRGLEPRLLRNYQVFTGYTFKSRDNENLRIEPSVFYQFFESDKRSATDLNLKFILDDSYEDYYWGGISYRFLNDQLGKPLNIGPMLGLKKSNFYFAYAYQVTTNKLIGYNSGTHVLTLGFDFFQGISDCPCTQSPVHD